MNTRFLIVIGVAFLLVFVCGVAAVVGINSISEQTVASTQVTPVTTTKSAQSSDAVSPLSSLKVEAPEPARAGTSPAIPTVVVSHPTTPMPVLDSDLVQLAAAVKLSGTNTGDVSREVWARETPIAQRLLHGLCDCDQRNWLNHFVKTGNEALSGSDDYYQSVQLLAKLRRNDQELSANGPLR